MKLFRESNESEMVLEFLKGEINSNRFNADLINVLKQLDFDEDLIYNGDTSMKRKIKKD